MGVVVGMFPILLVFLCRRDALWWFDGESMDGRSTGPEILGSFPSGEGVLGRIREVSPIRYSTSFAVSGWEVKCQDTSACLIPNHLLRSYIAELLTW